MTIDTGGPAFPFIDSASPLEHSGMALRDYFATHASEADIAPHLLGPWRDIVHTGCNGQKYIASRAQTPVPQAQARYLFADTMMKARVL